MMTEGHTDSTGGTARPPRRRITAVRASTDPTRVLNQPALRTSDGTIWIVLAGIFAAVCVVPLAMVLAEPGPSVVVAWITLLLLIVLYAALIACRITISDRVRRLRLMAILMLGMAGVALLGMMVCVALEWSAVPQPGA
jgi:hypothetical protein